MTSGDRASRLAGLSFDAAVWELWPYPPAVASVHLADEVTRNSAEFLRDWLLTRKANGKTPGEAAESLSCRYQRDCVARA